jgi:hypothetical protein
LIACFARNAQIADPIAAPFGLWHNVFDL